MRTIFVKEDYDEVNKLL